MEPEPPGDGESESFLRRKRGAAEASGLQDDRDSVGGSSFKNSFNKLLSSGSSFGKGGGVLSSANHSFKGASFKLRCLSKEATAQSFARGSSHKRGHAVQWGEDKVCSSSNGNAPADAVSENGSSHGSSPNGRGATRRRRSSEQFIETSMLGVQLLQRRMFGHNAAIYAHSDAAASLLARRVKGEKLSCRERVFLFLEEPGASTGAFWFGIFMWVLLFASAAFTTLETLAFWHSWVSTWTFLVAKIFFNVVFTIEGLMRVITYTPFHRAWRSPILWLDILTVVPFWVRLAVMPASLTPTQYFLRTAYNSPDVSFTVRVLEALSSMRLLKLARYYEGAALLMRAMVKSAYQLLVPLFMLFIMVVCFSALLVELEWSEAVDTCISEWIGMGVSPGFIRKNRMGVTWDCGICDAHGWNPWDASAMTALLSSGAGAGGGAGGAPGPSQESVELCATCVGYPPAHPECLGGVWTQSYPDIPTAMMFLIVTVTPAVNLDPTVHPVTWRGKFFIASVIIVGLLFLAMPLAVVGANFNRVWEERDMIKLRMLVRQLLMENDMSANDCRLAFSQFDSDGDGMISYAEFCTFVRTVLGMRLPKTQFNKLWYMLDEVHSGSIDFYTFTDHIFPSYEVEGDDAGAVPGPKSDGAPSFRSDRSNTPLSGRSGADVSGCSGADESSGGGGFSLANGLRGGAKSATPPGSENGSSGALSIGAPSPPVLRPSCPSADSSPNTVVHSVLSSLDAADHANNSRAVTASSTTSNGVGLCALPCSSLTGGSPPRQRRSSEDLTGTGRRFSERRFSQSSVQSTALREELLGTTSQQILHSHTRLEEKLDLMSHQIASVSAAVAAIGTAVSSQQQRLDLLAHSHHHTPHHADPTTSFSASPYPVNGDGGGASPPNGDGAAGSRARPYQKQRLRRSSTTGVIGMAGRGLCDEGGGSSFVGGARERRPSVAREVREHREADGLAELGGGRTEGSSGSPAACASKDAPPHKWREAREGRTNSHLDA